MSWEDTLGTSVVSIETAGSKRVYLWRIHFDIWQNQYNIVKLKNKIKIKKKKKTVARNFKFVTLVWKKVTGIFNYNLFFFTLCIFNFKIEINNNHTYFYCPEKTTTIASNFFNIHLNTYNYYYVKTHKNKLYNISY